MSKSAERKFNVSGAFRVKSAGARPSDIVARSKPSTRPLQAVPKEQLRAIQKLRKNSVHFKRSISDRPS